MLVGWQQDLPGDGSDYEDVRSVNDAEYHRLMALRKPPGDATKGSKWLPWSRLTEWEMAILRKRMKQNAFWVPSANMVRRELMNLERGMANRDAAKAAAEAGGALFVDETDEPDPTKFEISNEEQAIMVDQLGLQADWADAEEDDAPDAELINRGLKLDEAKKLRRARLLEEQEEAAARAGSNMSAKKPFAKDDPHFDHDLLAVLDHDNPRLLLELLDQPDYVGTLDLGQVMYAAVQKRAPNCLEAAIKLVGTTPNKRYRVGRTLLHHAVHLGAVSSLDILLKHLDDVALIDAESEELESPLCAAVRLGRVHCVETLLCHGANPNDRRALLAAALSDDDDADSMGQLVAAGADVNMPCEGYVSFLGAAAARGNVHIMTNLLNNGANINEVGLSDHSAAYGTPLCTAVVRGSIPAVNLLLRRGADVSLAGPRGDPLTIARAELVANPSTEDTYRKITELLEATAATDQVTPHTHDLEQTNRQETSVHAGDSGENESIQPQITDSAAKAQYQAGDIVYIPRQEPNRLRYLKCFYVRNLGEGKHLVQDWKTTEQFEACDSDLVLKTSLSAEQAAMAEAFNAHTHAKPASTDAAEMLDITTSIQATSMMGRETMKLLLERTDKLLLEPPTALDTILKHIFQETLQEPGFRGKIVAGERVDMLTDALYSAGSKFEIANARDPDALQVSLPVLHRNIAVILGTLADGFERDDAPLDVDRRQQLICALRDDRARCFTKSGQQSHLLRHAAVKGSLETLLSLMKYGIDIHEKVDEGGNTALHLAAKNRRTRFARHLLQHGAVADCENVCEAPRSETLLAQH